MSEQWIEIDVDRAMDRLDRRFLRGELTPAEYDKSVSELDKWATQESRLAKYGRLYFFDGEEK